MITLKPIWDAAFDIYKEMDAICKRHGLKVFVSGGTALGAVRHGGFIPWDDDFDVSMPRKDLEEFLKVAPKELPSWLTIVSYRNCAAYRNLFSKVIVCDPDRLTKICDESGMPAPQGIFVDIFPIDGYPNSWLGKRLRLVMMALTRFLLQKMHTARANGLMEWFASRCCFEGARKATDWCGWYKEEKKFIGRDDDLWPSAATFGVGKEVPFMSGKVRVPSDVDKYLKWQYGDYMKLPPEDQRHPDHTREGVATAPWRLGPCQLSI